MMAQASNCCSGLGALAGQLSPELFRALADPRRLEILTWLAERCDRPTVGEIAAAFPVDLSVVSRHLAVLRKAGIVAAERRGRHTHYRVRYRELAAALRAVADAIEACCPLDEPQQPRDDGAPAEPATPRKRKGR